MDSSSGSSIVRLQKRFSDTEFLSVLIRADDKGDLHSLGSDMKLCSLHCIHNIEVSELVITKQLYYTISLHSNQESLNNQITVNSYDLIPELMHLDGAFQCSLDDSQLYSQKSYPGRSSRYLSDSICTKS